MGLKAGAPFDLNVVLIDKSLGRFMLDDFV